MLTPDPQCLLSVWEHGARRHPLDRALLLYALAAPGRPADTLADTPLGTRNAALLDLREACFDTPLEAWADCSACGERMSVTLERAALPPAPLDTDDPIEVAGRRFHRPTSRHLATLARACEPDDAARQLLRACADAPDTLPSGAALDALLTEVESVFDAVDPWADIAIAITCPACAHDGEVSFDISIYLWEELDRYAHGLLDDIHALARAYGWREADILALSPARRAAYLARVETS